MLLVQRKKQNPNIFISNYIRINPGQLKNFTMSSFTIPKTVKQWQVAEYNGFEGLKFSEQPLPEVGDNEVLVKRMY